MNTFDPNTIVEPANYWSPAPIPAGTEATAVVAPKPRRARRPRRRGPIREGLASHLFQISIRLSNLKEVSATRYPKADKRNKLIVNLDKKYLELAQTASCICDSRFYLGDAYPISPQYKNDMYVPHLIKMILINVVRNDITNIIMDYANVWNPIEVISKQAKSIHAIILIMAR